MITNEGNAYLVGLDVGSTASVGLPATDHTGISFIMIFVARNGSKIEIDLPTALCWVAGATTVISAIGASASYAAQRPTELTPSSLVSRIEGFISFTYEPHRSNSSPIG